MINTVSIDSFLKIGNQLVCWVVRFCCSCFPLEKDPHLIHVFLLQSGCLFRQYTIWATMEKYNISTDLIQVVQDLNDKATGAVPLNSNIGDWFRTTVGVRQGCLLPPTLFNIFLERIITDALEGHEGTVSIGGRTITNLRFADDIDGLAEEEEELAKLVERLDKGSTTYDMEISAEKTKLMTNNTSGINTEIKWTEA